MYMLFYLDQDQLVILMDSVNFTKLLNGFIRTLILNAKHLKD